MNSVATGSGTRSQLFYIRVWLVVTLLLIVSTQTIAAPEAFGDESSDAVNSASDFPLGGTIPEEVAEASTLYAGQHWTVTDARAEQVEGLLVRPNVEVDVTITNTLRSTTVRVPDSLVALVSESGELGGDARFVDSGSRLTIGPGDTVTLTIVFEVAFTQAPQLDELSLTIGELNRLPASIPLNGGSAENPFPIFAAVDEAPLSLTDPDEISRQIVVTASGASFDVNAGPYRAATGERLAIVEVDVQRAEANSEAGFLTNDFWELETDEGSVPALVVAQADQPASNTETLTLLFAFPEGASEFALVADAAGAGPGSISIVAPN